MAARLNGAHQKDIRDKIKVSQLVKRLEILALGEDDPLTGSPLVLEPDRLRAIDMLLKKALPDLSNVSVEITGKDGGPVQIEDTGARDKLAAILARQAGT